MVIWTLLQSPLCLFPATDSLFLDWPLISRLAMSFETVLMVAPNSGALHWDVSLRCFWCHWDLDVFCQHLLWVSFPKLASSLIIPARKDLGRICRKEESAALSWHGLWIQAMKKGWRGKYGVKFEYIWGEIIIIKALWKLKYSTKFFSTQMGDT